MESLADVIDAHAARRPRALALALAAGDARLDWGGYRSRSDRLARALAGLGLETGERIAVWLPDGPEVHVVYVAAEKVGLVTVGIGPRAGPAELEHLLRRTGAVALLTRDWHRGVETAELATHLREAGLPLRHHLVVTGDLEESAPLLVDGAPTPVAGSGPPAGARRLRPDDVFLLNSTSGTTGLPKCVVHDQQRWFYFHQLAVEAGELSGDDVFLSALPTPFGFGIWTAHVTPALLGAPVVLLESFSPEETLAAIERHRVTVLAAVSTQFVMLLDSPHFDGTDLSSLRVLFTGGEAVPTERAVAFERRTGARVLQFYGSNETGALSRTTLADSAEVRLETAGRVIEGMNVRLFDERGRDVTAEGVGQPGCRGPAASRGYWDDPEANAALYTEEGWMLTGDVATLDADGVLRIVGRVADFIIRGGKNISGPEVEEAVASHRDVVLAAAVSMPDPVFGERVCVYAELRPGAALSLAELNAHLESRGVSKELFPERLVSVDELPRSSGGKIAKAELRRDIRRRLQREGG